MFLEVWGRYAPVTAANWSEFLDVPGSLGSLRSGYCRELVRVPGCSWKSGVATLQLLPRIGLSSWMFLEVWGRYAPDTAANIFVPHFFQTETLLN